MSEESEIPNIRFYELVLTESEVQWLIEHLKWFKQATGGKRGGYNLCSMEDEPTVLRLLTILKKVDLIKEE